MTSDPDPLPQGSIALAVVLTILLGVSLAGCFQSQPGNNSTRTPEGMSDDYGDASDLDGCVEKASDLETADAARLRLAPSGGPRRVNLTVDRAPRGEGVLSFGLAKRRTGGDPVYDPIVHYAIATFEGRTFVAKNPWPEDFRGRSRDIDFPFSVTLEPSTETLIQIQLQASADRPLLRVETTGYRIVDCIYLSQGSIAVDNATTDPTSGDGSAGGLRIDRSAEIGNRRYAVVHCAVRTGGPSSPLGESLSVNLTSETGNTFGMSYSYGSDEAATQPIPYGFCFPARGIRERLQSTLTYEPNGANATAWSLWMYSRTEEPLET